MVCYTRSFHFLIVVALNIVSFKYKQLLSQDLKLKRTLIIIFKIKFIFSRHNKTKSSNGWSNNRNGDRRNLFCRRLLFLLGIVPHGVHCLLSKLQIAMEFGGSCKSISIGSLCTRRKFWNVELSWRKSTLDYFVS